MIDPDLRQIPKAHHSGVQQRAENSASCPVELLPELRLVTAHLGLQFREFNDQCPIEKIRPRSTKVGNGIEHYGPYRIEDCLIVVTVELPPAKPAARC